MKIAILGSAPSVAKAPFDDESWEIWACNFNTVPRITRWFQFHPDQDLVTYPGLIDWMKAQTIPIYMQHRREDVPSSVTYPLQDMVAKYGTWFFTSTIAYELALAIDEKPDEIGLWGVTMDHKSEYASQKPGAHFFIHMARLAGIKVTVPPDCELLTDGKLYLYGRDDRLYAKVMARKEELVSRINNLAAQRDHFTMSKMMLRGARDLKLPQENIDTQLKHVETGLAEADRALLSLQGALELIDHIEDNWL